MFWVLFTALWVLYAAIPQRGPELSLVGAQLENMILPRVGGHFQTEVKEVSRWEERGSRIRWSFGTRWWSWSGQVGVQSSWRKSLSPRRPRSGNGRIGRTVTRGRRSDGLTTPEREELSRLKRELRQVKLEREILAKATAWFARETGSMPSGGSSS